MPIGEDDTIGDDDTPTLRLHITLEPNWFFEDRTTHHKQIATHYAIGDDVGVRLPHARYDYSTYGAIPRDQREDDTIGDDGDG